MDKKVFISHSSKDKVIADQICNTIENNGIGCWIAPRDIPYGNEWAGEITKALRQARICIFLFSKHSNQSKQVAKEIQIAIDNEVIIIPIRVENVEMNDVLTYYLATMHWLLEYDEKTLLDRVKKALLTPETEQSRQNVDILLQEKINEYFPVDNTSSVLVKNPRQERMKKRISKKHMDKLIKNLTDISETRKNVQSENEDIDSQNYGKHFSLVDNDGQVTIAFEVISVLDEEKKAFVRSYLEELSYTDEPLNDGRTKRTFYIDYPYYYGMPICTRIAILTFCPKECCVFVNNAVCEDDKVYIAKNPEVWFWDDDNNKITPDCNYIIVGNNVYDELSADSESDIIIISLETFDVIKRQKQFDSIVSDWKTTIKLEIEKPYFVVKTQDKVISADETSVALGYLHGMWGLPHNILKAIDLLEENSSAKAKYILAKIFENDDLLKDDDDYIYYLTQSANSGYVEAMLRLSNEYIDGVCVKKDYSKAKELLEAIASSEPENGTAWNNLGWLYENGYGCQQDYFEACRTFKKAIGYGSKKAFKHLAEIALLSKEEVLPYKEGLYYLCCAQRLGEKNIEDVLAQYSECLANYSQLLEDAEQKASEVQFKEFENTKLIVQDTTEGFRIVGGFPKWS